MYIKQAHIAQDHWHYWNHFNVYTKKKSIRWLPYHFLLRVPPFSFVVPAALDLLPSHYFLEHRAAVSTHYITQEIQNVFFKFKHVNISSLQKTHSGFNIIICEINLNLSTFLAPGHCRPLGAACNHSPAALRPSQAGPAHAVPCGLE